MALIRIDAGSGGDAGAAALPAALAALPARRPVTILIHGFRFCPSAGGNDPHRHILSLRPDTDCWKAVSWPRHLHLDRPGAGLGVAFGWPARGTLPGVAMRAFDIARDLAHTIALIRSIRPDVPVHLVAHSLGARVALGALPGLAVGDVSRIILLSGAEYRGLARRALDSPAGRRAEVLNVASGENAPFDLAFRGLVRGPWDRAIGAGLGHLVANWTDLRIDDAAHLAALAALGYPTRPPRTRICHWSSYLRPGLFALYRRVLDPAQPDLLPRLRAALPVRERTGWSQKIPEIADFRNPASRAARP